MGVDGGSLGTDPLFLGLTRPALIGGVTYTFFALNSFIFMIAFVLTSEFKVFLFGIVTHLFGMLISKKEPLAVEILLTKVQKCPANSNNRFHGNLNSYNMF